MEYKVVKTNHGFKGRMWEAGQIVDLDPSDNPPKFFVPVEDLEPEKPKVPHRTEPLEMAPGAQRKVEGGFADGKGIKTLPRILTTDEVPNNVEEPVKKKRRRRRSKDVGSVKK